MGYGFLQDEAGNNSSYRLIMVMFFACLCLAFLIVTVWLCHLDRPAIPDVPVGVQVSAGLVLGGKAVQFGGELLRALKGEKPQGG